MTANQPVLAVEHLSLQIGGARILEDVTLQVAEGEMPLSSYTWLHEAARLTTADREALAAWFNATVGGHSTHRTTDEMEHGHED